MTKTLRELAAEQLDAFMAEYGAPDDREQAIDRWMHRLIATGDVPDNILEALPEVSRHNEPQIAPQEYECGCVAMLRITDRDGRKWLGHDEKPFELRLAISCRGESCELPHLRGDGERGAGSGERGAVKSMDLGIDIPVSRAPRWRRRSAPGSAAPRLSHHALSSTGAGHAARKES